jgi:hypothetical protein
MRYEELTGTDLFIRQLVERAHSKEKADEDFVIIQPGGELKQADFIR